MTPELIHKSFDNDHLAHGHGRKCRFFKIDDNSGIKCYETYNDAETSFGMQLIMHKLGMAPNCWGWHTIGFDNHTYYCFFTELAQVYKDGMCPSRQDILSELNKYGFHHHDLCHFNVGKLPSGKDVPVDFGDMSYIPHQNERNPTGLNFFSGARHIDAYTTPVIS